MSRGLLWKGHRELTRSQLSRLSNEQLRKVDKGSPLCINLSEVALGGFVLWHLFSITSLAAGSISDENTCTRGILSFCKAIIGVSIPEQSVSTRKTNMRKTGICYYTSVAKEFPI